MKCSPAICAVYVTAFLLCNLNENKKVAEKVVFSGFLNAYQVKGVLCNATKIQLFKKSFEKTWKNRRFKSHPLRDAFSRVPWQLNDRPKVILRQDLVWASVKTLRWDSGAGTISGKTAKACIKDTTATFINFYVYQEHFQTLDSHLYIEQVCSFSCVHTYTCTHVRREIA